MAIIGRRSCECWGEKKNYGHKTLLSLVRVLNGERKMCKIWNDEREEREERKGEKEKEKERERKREMGKIRERKSMKKVVFYFYFLFDSIIPTGCPGCSTRPTSATILNGCRPSPLSSLRWMLPWVGRLVACMCLIFLLILLYTSSVNASLLFGL